jgi:putative transcriptional regulator
LSETVLEVKILAVRNNLKDIRYDHRMNQMEFAEYIGVNRSLYNRWEKQHTQPNVVWLLKISKILKKSIEEIVYLDGPE